MIRKPQFQPIVLERLQKQLVQLYQLATQLKYQTETVSTQHRVSVILKVPKLSIEGIYLQTQQSYLQFQVEVRKAYPRQGVLFHCNKLFTIPSLADLRDYTLEVLQERWTHTCKLSSLVRKLKAFAQKCVRMSAIEIQQIGRLPFGNLAIRAEVESKIDIFNALEEISQGKVRRCWLGLSDCHFFIYTIHEDDRIFMSAWCEVQAVAELGIQQKKSVRMKFQNKEFVFKLTEQDKFVGSLLKRQWEFNVDQQHLTPIKNAPKISRPQLSLEKALQQSVLYQEQLKRHFTAESIQSLNNVYQHIVETYSSSNNPLFIVYLHKIARLCSKPDVQVILSVAKS